MATLSRGQTFGATETVTNTKLHNLVDLGSISNIVAADISPSAGINDTQLADIVTGNKVRGTALGNLSSIPSGAGLIPPANIPFTSFPSLASIPNYALQPLTLASWVDGAAFRNLQSSPSLAGVLPYFNMVASLASGATVQYDGNSNLVGAPYNAIRNQIFLSSGTFTVPAGITTVYLSMCGGGAAGGNGQTGTNQSGGGGGAGGYFINKPYTVTPGNSYTVTIGAGGTAGVSSGDSGTAGNATSFDALSAPRGEAGQGSGSSGTGGAGGGSLNASGGTAGIGVSPGGNGADKVSTTIGGGGGATPFGAGGNGGTSGNGTLAAANTGSGGGGAGGGGGTNIAGIGGSGICIVSY